MDINKAAEMLQTALETLRDDSDTWNPSEIRVLPSGDDMDHIKIWLNFPDQDDDSLATFKKTARAELSKRHAEIVDAYEIEIRADAD